MRTIEIVFDTDGNGECLWTEALPLHAIGKLAMRRASNIEFNAETQKWEVWQVTNASLVELPDVRLSKLVFMDASRDRCLEWEHQYFNQQLAQS